jgi:tetratricopeptide (TPR) repeat protein
VLSMLFVYFVRSSRSAVTKRRDLSMLRSLVSRSSKAGIACLIFICMAAEILSAADGKSVYEQAVSKLQAGHTEAATALLAPWIESRPGDVKALTLMGMALATSGDLDRSNSYFERVLRIRPNYPPALRGLALNEMALKQYDAAQRHLDQLVSVSPNDAAAHASLGEIAVNKGNYPAAARHFEQAGPPVRENPRLLLAYARASAALKNTEKAATLLSSMPDTAAPQDHFEAGNLLASLKSYKPAARQFELALPGYPDPYVVGYNLVLARIKTEDYAIAIAEGEKLIESGHRKAELYNLLSEAYEKSGDTKRAYDSLRSATQIDPTDEANYLDLIGLCIDHKNYDLASEIAGIGLSRLPKSERIHLQFGVVLAMKEQFEEAHKQFELAEHLAPNRSLPYVALALVLIQMNRASDAVQTLRARVRNRPNDYLALWYLGEALDRNGTTPGSAEQREAITALQRSVRLNPEISQSRELLGKLLSREGRLDEAAQQLEAAIRLEPGNEAAIYQLAQVYSKKGDTARSKPLFAKVSQMKADERENFAKRRLQQIVRADSSNQ